MRQFGKSVNISGSYGRSVSCFFSIHGVVNWWCELLTFVDVVEKTLDVLKPRDCSEIYNFGRRSSGVYTVYSGRTARRTEVYCDMWTDGGGWTVCIATNMSPSKCSVLFFSRPRSDSWPHYARTFSIYLCPLSFWLTLPRVVLSTSWCCPSRPCVAFLACMHVTLFLALSFSRQLPCFLIVWP